jgi:zinc finger protein 830
MSDVRALLKAKRQEARITHPFASYSSTGQLRCKLCNTLVKHTSAWQGHLGSKLHRNNVAEFKEQQSKAVQEAVREEDHEEEEEEGEEEEEEGRKLEQSNLPNFPSRTPLNLPTSGQSGGGEGTRMDVTSDGQPTAIDLEWQQFQRDVVNAPELREVYDRATVIAEPEIASSVPDGFPSVNEAEVTNGSMKTEEDARRLKEQEERELIMDRLMDEERAQEDADLKVTLMKQKMALLKRKREAVKAKAKMSAVPRSST